MHRGSAWCATAEGGGDMHARDNIEAKQVSKQVGGIQMVLVRATCGGQLQVWACLGYA